jgi:exosome complex RNA-binding protein Csl4
MIQIAADRLSNAKRAFTTRNVDTSALCAISNDVAPRAGDVVLARVLEVGAHRRLELPTSR